MSYSKCKKIFLTHKLLTLGQIAVSLAGPAQPQCFTPKAPFCFPLLLSNTFLVGKFQSRYNVKPPLVLLFSFYLSLFTDFSSTASISYLHTFFHTLQKHFFLLSSSLYLLFFFLPWPSFLQSWCFVKEISVLHLLMVQCLCSLLSCFSSSLQNTEGDKQPHHLFIRWQKYLYLLTGDTATDVSQNHIYQDGYPVTDLSQKSVSFTIVPK